MANAALAVTPNKGLNWAIEALTVKAYKSAIADRLKAIELLAHKTGSDVVMILGSALADFGSSLSSTEKISLATALGETCTGSLSKELAISFLTRAALRESQADVRAVLHSVLEKLE